MKKLVLVCVLLCGTVGLKASTMRLHRLYAAAQVPTTSTWPDDEFATMGLDINFDNLPAGDDYNYQCYLIANGSPGTRDNESCTFKMTWVSHGAPTALASSQRINFATGLDGNSGAPVTDPADFKIKWYVGGQACSDWLDQPYTFTMTIANACLDALDDGWWDVSVDIQSGAVHQREDFMFWSSELYLYRNNGDPVSNLAPMIAKGNVYLRYIDQGGISTATATGSRVAYADPSALTPRAHPARTDVMGVAWHTAVVPSGTTDLYQEECAPHSDLFHSEQFIWKMGPEYPTPNLRYFFQMVAKLSEEHDTLYYSAGNNVSHNDLPIRDGGRGQWWGTSYVGGMVKNGNLYIVEVGGAFRELNRACEMETLGGWHLDATEMPIQMEQVAASNHLAHKQVIHDNMHFAGDFGSSLGDAPYEGMRTPLDVSDDPDDDETFYIPAYHDNVIWRAVEGAGAGGSTQFTIWAGQLDRSAGFANGDGNAAKFSGPTSMVRDTNCTCWYVADQNNHRIRKITKNMDGTSHVTTIYGDGDPWTGIEDDVTLTGTADFSTTSTIVTGHGTSFTTQVTRFSDINATGGVGHVLVDHVVDDTTLVLTAVSPVNASGASVGRYGASLYNDNQFGNFDRLVQSNMQVQSGNKRYLVSPTDAAGGKIPDMFYPMTVRVTSTGDLCVLGLADAGIRCINVATNVTRYIASLGTAINGAGHDVARRAWRWMDIDRTGNSGPLDGIYYGGFQVTFCEQSTYDFGTNHPNEAYCWVASNSAHYVRTQSDSGQFWFNDGSGNPDGWGKIAETDPPHYYWMAVIDPEGGLYLAGGGETGITRVRPRQSYDPFPTTTFPNYYYAKLNWKLGGCSTALPLELLYGPEGHNYIGAKDLWDYDPSISDADLITAFGLEDSCIDAQHDPNGSSPVKAWMLDFMRLNMGPPVPDTAEAVGQSSHGVRQVRVGRGAPPPEHKRQ